MPVCMDCDRWSPGTFKRCPDCEGTLKLEPLWARPSRDAQLARLDDEAKTLHRHGELGAVADRRRRYEELRRRLLPVLEAAEAQRVQRMRAGARAAGVSLRAYESRLRQEERERDATASRARNELFRAHDTGRISREEYERSMAALDERLADERARTTEEAARTEGMSISDYRARAARELWVRRRLWGGEDRWLTDAAGMGQAWFVTFLALPIAGAIGLAVLLLFLLAGRSPLAAVGGTVLGGIGGWILAQVLFFATWAILEWLAPRFLVVRRSGEAVLMAAVVGVFLVPPVLVVAVALWLG